MVHYAASTMVTPAISLVYLYSFLCEKHSGTPEVHNPPQTFKKVTVKAAQTLSGRKQQHQAEPKGLSDGCHLTDRGQH